MNHVAKIRELNDEFRKTLKGGRVMITRGLISRDEVMNILKRVQTFDAFSQDNDPHGEHDFGAFEFWRDTIFWKMDYYAKDLTNGSPNPADPNVTVRVLTVMLAEEY